MAKDKIRNKKLNFFKIRKYLNILMLNIVLLIFILFFFILFSFYSRMKETDLNFIKEKKEKLYENYTKEIFQKILFLSYSTPFLNYLHAGEASRNILEVDLLKNFNPYVSKEIIGYKLLDHSKNPLSAVGKESDTHLLLELCYLNNIINPIIGRCKAFLYIYFNYDAVMEKIKNIDPDWISCTGCYEYKIPAKSIINGIRIIENNNFIIPYTIEKSKNEKFLIYLLLSISFIVVIILVAFYINHLILKKCIITPIKNLFLYVQNENIKGPFVLEEISVVVDKIDELKEKIKSTEREKQQEQFMKLAQVAHDIRSPLAALNVFLSLTSELPEDKRVLARNAIYRIQDIANNLVKKQQNIFQNCPSEHIDEPMSVQFISNLIEVLVSEKRLQFKDKHNILIEFNSDHDSYGIFSFIQANEFKRMLSNLINNAIEAIEEKGSILISLVLQKDNCILKLQDNGRGIPPHILPKLMKAGATYDKKGGTGLGLAHASMMVKKWGGLIEIDSKVNYGTTLTISLPMTKAPIWFLPKLCISPQAIVVIIDDDTSIHDIWEERFKSFKKINCGLQLVHFSNPKDFIASYTAKKFETVGQVFYLCDYEFINYEGNGLELVTKFGLTSDAIIVSSRFEDKEIQSACEQKNLKLIPKNLVYLLPISIVKTVEIDSLLVAKSDQKFNQVHAILIDDDLFMHELWQMTAPDKSILCFTDPKIFFDKISEFNKDVPIYIDSNLSEKLKGEEVAKEIYQQGFKNIYLATGYSPNHFPKMDWIKEVRDKTPPWFH